MLFLKLKHQCFQAITLSLLFILSACGSSSLDYRSNINSSDSKAGNNNNDPSNQQPKDPVSPLVWDGQKFGESKKLLIYPID